jgi:hypothetical protein
METIHELYAKVNRIKKTLGIDKPAEGRIRGIMEQLGDNSILAIGTVVPPIRQDADAPERPRQNKSPL